MAVLTASGTHRPTVSVIVPCFNYGRFLEGCVESVLSQDGVDVRLLIIDDRSTDGSAAIGRQVAARDARIAFRAHDENQGLIGTANEGLAWADGEFVVLLSADDLLVPGCLRRAVTVMTRDPGVGMVYGRPQLAHGEHTIPKVSGRWRATDIRTGRDWIHRRCRSGYNCISSPEVVVRTSIHRAAGGYDPACTHASDLNMWLRIASLADVAYVRGVPQAIYRVHQGSMLRSQEGPLVDLRERRIAFDSFFRSCRSRLERPDDLEAMAGRALARQALWRASRGVDRGRLDAPDAVPVDDLVAFALDVYPDAPRLREWHGLALRRRIGAGRSRLFLPFVATGAAHRLRHHLAIAQWKARGI